MEQVNEIIEFGVTIESVGRKRSTQVPIFVRQTSAKFLISLRILTVWPELNRGTMHVFIYQ
jgi:hypothetical protein